jgi:hypothetical protein
MPTQKPPTLHDLDLLGRHYSLIHGRALTIKESRGKERGAYDPTDDLCEHATEIQRALRALSKLTAMGRQGLGREAAVLCYVLSICGAEARASGAPFVEVALQCDGGTLPAEPPLSVALRHKGGLRLRGEELERLRRDWRDWRARRGALERRGRELFERACEAWEGKREERRAA